MTMSDQPEWLAEAWRELGQSERAGKAANARIAAFFNEAGHPGVKSDEVAWCAAFAGACLERAGLRSSRSLLARSYLDWGRQLEAERIGAVAVLRRGTDPAFGHVGFLVGWTADGLWLLGGNQMNAVSVARYERSRLVGLRWAATDVEGQSGDGAAHRTDAQAVFAFALAHVLEMEGGYTDDPHDPGGPTNKGITLATLAADRGVKLTTRSRPRLMSDLKALADREAEDIYRRRYWRPSGSSELPPGLAVMHFDAAVNHGVGTAIRMLQAAVGVAADGEIGPQTRAAVAAREANHTLESYAALRRRRYEGLPHFWRFGRGWLRRVDATLAAADAAARRAARPQTSHSEGDKTMPEFSNAQPAEAKWWGHSLTIWGALTTAAAAVLPVVGSMVGIALDAETVRQIGSDTLAVVQALTALSGTIMTIIGRARATQPLERRSVVVKL
ncbi:MAG: TIGR02594 family protein [Hyphomicrobiaceae bacterium]|nr:TIGR02594 family protein [Hyphomicrobiaceae bacterium]